MNSSIGPRNTSVNIIIDLARMRGEEIKTIKQYHSASQSISIQGTLKLDMMKHKEEDKHKYKSHFPEQKCGSC